MTKITKGLKIWNGRACGKYMRQIDPKTNCYYDWHMYVAARSQKQAVELLNKACGCYLTVYEIKNYYAEGCWGNAMEDIDALEPCVYICENRGKDRKPIRIL